MVAVLPLLLAWLVAVVSPGPDFLAVLRTSAAHGRAAGLRVGLGVVCGIACWATLAICGLSALLARYEHLYLVIRGVGAVLLIGYGVHILWSSRTAPGDAVAAVSPPGKQGSRFKTTGRDLRCVGVAGSSRPQRPTQIGSHWRLGVFTNLANPKALVFFGALFATLMPHHESVGFRAVVLVTMLAMAVVWFAVVSWCAGSRPVVAAYRRLQRVIDRVAGGLFTAIGITLVPR